MRNHMSMRTGHWTLALLVASVVATGGCPPAAGLISARPAAAQTEAGAPPSPEEIEKRRAEQAQVRTAVPFEPTQFDNYVGTYQLVRAPNAFFTITRKDDHFFSQLTGQPTFEVFPESAAKFFYKVVPAQISFATDAQGKATELVLHQNGLEQHAKRVDEAVASRADAALQKRIAENKPDPEREALLRRSLAEDGKPDADIMSPELLAAATRQWPSLQNMNQRLGKLTALTFVHVDMHGNDVYEAAYEHGHLSWVVGPLSPDHKLQGLRGM